MQALRSARGAVLEVPRRLRLENRNQDSSLLNRSKDNSLARTPNRQKPVVRGAFGPKNVPLHGPGRHEPRLALRKRTHARHGPDLAPAMQATSFLPSRGTVQTTQSSDSSWPHRPHSRDSTALLL